MDDLLQRPPIKDQALSLILLALPPAEPLEASLFPWLRILEDRQREYEALLVLPAGHPPVELPSPRIRRIDVEDTRIGAALRDALPEARHPMVGYVDSLTAYQPGDFNLLLDAIDSVDFVAAERTWPPEVRPQRPGLLFRWLIRFLFGLRLRDPGSGIKLLRRSIVPRLPVQSNGAFAHIELLAKANFLGSLMAEVAVPYRPGSANLTRDPLLRRDLLAVLRNPDFGPASLEPPVSALPVPEDPPVPAPSVPADPTV